MNRISSACMIITSILLLPVQALCQPRLPHSPSDQEIHLLPEECKIIFKGSAEQKKLFYQQFPGLVGPNHYCWGMNFMNRAQYSSLDKIEKRFNLQSAIGEFGYVLKHSAPNARGLQQIKMHQEQAQLLLKMIK